MSALYITALLFVNTALLIHLFWDSAFITHTMKQSLGFAYFSPSIEAFEPSISSTNNLPVNVARIELSAESLLGNAASTWRMDSPLEPSVKVHPNDAELLAESLNQSTKQSINATENFIPNIAHFIIGATHTSRSTQQPNTAASNAANSVNAFSPSNNELVIESQPTFTLINYLSIKSAADLGGFDSIVCHVLNQPIHSVYWQLAMPYCTHIELIENDQSHAINHVFGRAVYHKSIKAEIARLRVLLQYGGHGIEDDVIFVNRMPAADQSITPGSISWLSHELVLGYTKSAQDSWPERPDVSIVSAKASSWMLAEWFATYRMYEDASTHRPINADGTQSILYEPDVVRWTHDLAYLLMLPRRHLLALAPVEWWGKLYVREPEGHSTLYDSNAQLDSLAPQTVAVHLWQSEMITVREQRQVDGSIVVSDVEPPKKYEVNSFAEICEVAKTSLYGQILKKAMLAGERHTHTCD